MAYHIEHHNLDGLGSRPVRVYDVPTCEAGYWPSVTDIPCPVDKCSGTIRWAEAGYVPGYRICDGCGRHFQASGKGGQPKLILDARYSPRR